MRKKRIWHVNRNDHQLITELSNTLGFSRVMSQILVNRGLKTPDDIRDFLYSGVNELHSPFDIPGISAGAKRVCKAIEDGESILIYGDYDVDGITSTALMTEILRKLNGRVEYYIPDRIEEGYGLNVQAIAQAAESGVNLIITVDCGISSIKETQLAKDLGMDMIITDHHQPPVLLPTAIAVINPKTAAEYKPWTELAGVGVAFKLVQAVSMLMGQGDICLDNLGLVALGTIADIVPLRDENRILVKEGLNQLVGDTRPGIRALKEVSGIKPGELSAEQVGFALAPRLNACGRLGKADFGVKLLLTEDRDEALEIAGYLNEENQSRQRLEQEILEEALVELEKQSIADNDKIIILAGENWHPGVIGIVASRLVDRFYRPTIMISLENGIGKGSGRSIPGFNLYGALEHVKDCLINFGGHEMAAGLSIEGNSISLVRDLLNRYADNKLQKKDLVPVLNVDAELPWQDINQDLIREIGTLAPFGYRNPYPLFALRGKEISGCREVGPNGNHLKLKIIDNKASFNGIGFKMGALKEAASSWEKCDLAFVPEINKWNGHSQIQLNVKDIKPMDEPDDPFVPLPFLDKLYLEGEAWLEEDYYRDIADREEFFTKVVGVTYDNRQEVIKSLLDGDSVLLIRESDNSHDPYAIGVYHDRKQIGYLNSRLARNLAPSLDNGTAYVAYITHITGRDKETMGVNLCIQKMAPDLNWECLALTRNKLKHLSSKELEEVIRKAVLGEFDYHAKQLEAIEQLKDGYNTMVILSTGRGKSAVFQTMAAYLALTAGKVTIIVYPLRSLVNDQRRHLQEKLAPLGLKVEAINGSMNPEEKKVFFKRLHSDMIDIVLTTPEFLEYHLEKFKTLDDRIGLFVVDESHHLAHAKRKGYRQLARNWRYLGSPLSLAVTATADDETAQSITDSLMIQRLVVEDFERKNLFLIDKRTDRDKLAYLVNLIARDEKTVIYVNSRKQAFQLASDLRLYYPPGREKIGFYHGGLNSQYRSALEDMFREGTLQVMTTTSAFGEGINIPDIKHVVLYHLCFSATEFNQLSGRAGRNHNDAYIHILFNEKDKRLNEFILESAAPTRDILGKLYLLLRDQAQIANPVVITNHELEEAMQKQGVKTFREQTASTCLAILEELGLLLREVEGGRRYIHFVTPPPGKMDLNDSIRYLEGLNEWEAFQDFAQYALKVDPEQILAAINKPICPQKAIKLYQA